MKLVPLATIRTRDPSLTRRVHLPTELQGHDQLLRLCPHASLPSAPGQSLHSACAAEPIHTELPQCFRTGTPEVTGADEGSRTPGLDLGKVALYQLSYIRICEKTNRHPVVEVVSRQIVKELPESTQRCTGCFETFPSTLPHLRPAARPNAVDA